MRREDQPIRIFERKASAEHADAFFVGKLQFFCIKVLTKEKISVIICVVKNEWGIAKR